MRAAGSRIPRRCVAVILAIGVAFVASSCSFGGLNSLPLPGAVGRGAYARVYHAEFDNIGTLEANSPVLLDDVVVGSVSRMTFVDWRIVVEISVRGDVAVPANAEATVGQTSLLGTMHVALDPPVGSSPSGRLPAGATIPTEGTHTYPSTEQTLAALSTVVNGGGLGQIGEILHNLATAVSGREGDIRSLIGQLDQFVGALDRQRGNIVASIDAMNRLAGTLSGQRQTIVTALADIPPALDVLSRERPKITQALTALRGFSDSATSLINGVQDDLVTNLNNLQPTIRALADVGPTLDKALAFTTVFPFGQNLIDRGLKGDYMNLFAIVDLTVPRLKRSLMLGTRWGDENSTLAAAPGEPYYLRYTYDPIGEPLTPPPPGGPLGPVPGAPPTPGLNAAPPDAMPAVGLPVSPPPEQGAPPPPSNPLSPIFAGPYGPEQTQAPAGGT